MVASLPVALFSLAHWNKIHKKLKCNRTPIKEDVLEPPRYIRLLEKGENYCIFSFRLKK
jgi:hypothetical protein